MKFIKIAMMVPTPEGIYTPSSDESINVSNQVRSARPIKGKVSFSPDFHSNPVEINFYGFGLDCWYIREDEALAAGWKADIQSPMPILTAYGFELAQPNQRVKLTPQSLH